MWSPFDRRYTVRGILIHNGLGENTIATEPEVMRKALADHWGPVFAAKPITDVDADYLLDNYATLVNKALILPPP